MVFAAHDTLDEKQLSAIDTPLLASLSWLLLDDELRVVQIAYGLGIYH